VTTVLVDVLITETSLDILFETYAKAPSAVMATPLGTLASHHDRGRRRVGGRADHQNDVVTVGCHTGGSAIRSDSNGSRISGAKKNRRP
jgi:hypothetical protein